MATNEKDQRNQQTDSTSKEEKQDGTQKKETNPKDPAAIPRQAGQQPQGKQNEPVNQQLQVSTSPLTRTNTDVQDTLRREETTEANSTKRNLENLKAENQITQKRI